MISKRPYRLAFAPYSLIEYLTREAVSGKIDAKIFKAFLRLNSLYLIGSWVPLIDGRVSKLIGSGPNMYDRPVVRIFFKNNFRVPMAPPVFLNKEKVLKMTKAFGGNTMEGI